MSIYYNQGLCSASLIALLAVCVGCQTPSATWQNYTSKRRDLPSETQLVDSAVEPIDTHTDQQKQNVALIFASRLEKQGNADQAIGAYKNIVAKDPSNSQAYHRLGVLHSKIGAYAQAEEFYQKALQLSSNRAEVMCDYGYSLYLQQNWHQAEFVLKDALQEEPQHSRTHNNLALVYARSNRSNEALQEFRLACGNEQSARLNLAYAMMWDGQHSHARQHIEIAQATDAESESAAKAATFLAKLDAQPTSAGEKTSAGKKSRSPVEIDKRPVPPSPQGTWPDNSREARVCLKG